MQGQEDGGQHERQPSPATQRVSSASTLAVPKTRSSANLVIQSFTSAYNPAYKPRKFSLDSGSAESTSGSTSPILREHDLNGSVPSGLYRIRQQPTSRQVSSPDTQTGLSSMTINIPSPTPGSNLASAASPLLTTSEDLRRFPSESLHSFSFTQKPDDFIHARSNILKRTYDFLKEKSTWATGGLGIVNAQAKISGDKEVQGMVDLLSKANLLPSEGAVANAAAASLGPITGPAFPQNKNVFDMSFARAESPTPLESRNNSIAEMSETDVEPSPITMSKTPSLTVEDASAIEDAYESLESNLQNRQSLRRTYTDTAPLSLKNKLTDALGKPYIADESTLPSSPAMATQSIGALNAVPFSASQPQAHSRASVPVSQAIFTTESRPPWTISAANDLACLVFGLSKAELKKISILDMIREDKRIWLEGKLGGKGPSGPAKSASASPSPQRSSIMGNGVTARLLSRPSSRETGQGRRTKSDDGSGSSIAARTSAAKAAPNHPSNKERGVLLCGDVVPIMKRNGDFGSATLWVQEKRGGLIWVMEEIAEDVARLEVDEIGCVARASGETETIWGMERVRTGTDIARLIPGIPRLRGTNTGALDYQEISKLRGFTAKTANEINIPVTVAHLPNERAFRVSSFPNIAGMMVLSATTLDISSSNSVVAESLFGLVPNGQNITDLIPSFDKMLEILVNEDQVQLVEGMVIPEHSFRRARSMLALREGKAEAASIFLRPSGLPARHRDGAEIMLDVQMRVVKSDVYAEDDTIHEKEEDGDVADASLPYSQYAYALWVTYSRSLHAANHGVGSISPLISRPGTPPQQPSPGPSVVAIHTDDSDSDAASSRSATNKRTEASQSSEMSTISPRTDVTSTPSSITTDASPEMPEKKTISDFVILEEMGAGAYGQVKLARPKASPSKKVVIKYVTKRRILVDTWTRDRRLGTVPLEIHVLDYLRRDGFKHPNIVEMSGFFEDDINYYIEMVPHGLPGMDLFDYIELRMNMEEDECRRIFTQVASAVEFLHVKAKVVHRDIKDENVILDGEGRIKLIDFGSASYIKSGPFDVFVGTIDYAAPEVLAGKSYLGPSQDVWALGILLYTILYKENPFYSIDEIMDLDLRVPYLVSESSINLVRAMLERDVDRRLGVEDVVRHPWCTAEAATPDGAADVEGGDP